jgi:hypothetical protein
MSMRASLRLAAAVFAVGFCSHAVSAWSDTIDPGASWVFAPAQAPTPPGATQSPFPVPLGYVSDIEFWAPNRGLLITGGNADVPAGLFAYDGVSWHQLSTVCGATDGRIAWAGPDDFWTISDQRPGQIVPSGGSLQDISLCHFQNDRVVASYALPLGEQGSYEPMNAAACTGPNDCWFGGATHPEGAFHLHWNGTSLTEVDALQDHEAASMAVYNDQIFESVQLQPPCSVAAPPCDNYGSEDVNNPPVFHLIAPNDAADPFHSLYPEDGNPACAPFCPPLPDYTMATGATVNPTPPDLDAFALSSDWRAGPAAPQLWAVAGYSSAYLGSLATAGSATPLPFVLRYGGGVWTQVLPNTNLNVNWPAGQGSPDMPEGQVLGATPVPQLVAAEPNQNAAWIAIASPSIVLDHIKVSSGAGGAVTGATVDQVSIPGQNVGAPTAITCPAVADCWMATSSGWLYHLTNGTRLPQDTDPNFAGVISYRPPDGGVPHVIPPVEVGVAPPPPPPMGPTAPIVKRKVRHIKVRPLVTHIGRLRLMHRTILVLSFTLTAKARVRLIARRHGKIVAQTRRRVLRRGRHTLKLPLNVKRWPTALKLNAAPVGASNRSSLGTPIVT